MRQRPLKFHKQLKTAGKLVLIHWRVIIYVRKLLITKSINLIKLAQVASIIGTLILYIIKNVLFQRECKKSFKGN